MHTLCQYKFLLLGLLGGQKHSTGWAKIVTGWAIAHPVNMLSEALLGAAVTAMVAAPREDVMN